MGVWWWWKPWCESAVFSKQFPISHGGFRDSERIHMREYPGTTGRQCFFVCRSFHETQNKNDNAHMICNIKINRNKRLFSVTATIFGSFCSDKRDKRNRKATAAHPLLLQQRIFLPRNHHPYGVYLRFRTRGRLTATLYTKFRSCVNVHFGWIAGNGIQKFVRSLGFVCKMTGRINPFPTL